MNGGDIERNDGLRSASSFLGDDSLIGGSSTSLDTVRPDKNLRSPYRHPPLPRHPNLPRNDGLRSASSFLGDDLHIGRFGGSSSSLDTIGPPIIAINDENLQCSPYQHPTLPRRPVFPRDDGLRSASSFLGDDLHIGRFGGSSSSLDAIGAPINDENLQHSPNRHPARPRRPVFPRDDGLRSASSFLGDDLHIGRFGGSSSSLDAIRSTINDENLQRSPNRHPTRPRRPVFPRDDGLRSASSFPGDDLHIRRFGGSSSSLDAIGPPINDENLQRSPNRHPTRPQHSVFPRDDGLRSASSFLGDDLHIGRFGGSSSSLDAIRLPTNDENPQFRPYSSFSDLQSNGSVCSVSFATSPSYESLIEVSNEIAKAGSKDTSRGRLRQGYYKR
jgi:hypothetical protein